MICSLTRTAAAEVKRRGLKIPAQQIGTLHAHCYRALGRPVVAESRLKEWNEQAAEFRINGSGYRDETDEETLNEGASFGDKSYAAYTLLRARMTQRANWPDHVRRFASKWEEWKADGNYLDFEDMIDKSRTDCETAPGRPNVLYVDESQDCSASEIDLLVRWSGDAHVVFVGDLDQSVYVFRGAVPRAFYDLKIPDERRRVLSQSYRVPRAVRDAAMRWISQIRDREAVTYHARDADGEVKRLSANYRMTDDLLKEAAKYTSQGKSVMFIGSCAYHVEPVIRALRESGTPYYNPYREKNSRWNPLARIRGVSAVDRLEAFLEPQTRARWSLDGAKRWMDVVKSDGLLAKSAKTQLKAWLDKSPPDGLPLELTDEMLAALFVDGFTGAGEAMEAAWDGNYRWFTDRLLESKSKGFQFPLKVAGKHGIEALRTEPLISVGTIHSVKGGEASTVILFPDLSRAGMEQWLGTGEGRDAVVRLFYVGMTRARETLILCAPGGPLSMEWGALR